MRALQLIDDRKLEIVDLAAATAARARRGHAAHKGRRAQPYRRLGLARHGLRQAQDAAGHRRGSLRRSRHGRPRRLQPAARAARLDLRRAHLRPLPPLPRRPRQSLRTCLGRARLSSRRLCPGEDQSSGAPAGSRPARRRRGRRGGRAGHLRHRRAHAVRQCQARARRNDPRPCRRLGHRLGRDPARQEDGLHGHHHRRLRRQDRQGQGAGRRSRHQLPRGPLRGRRAQADQEEGRRRRLRTCRRRHLGRLDVVPEARRASGDLRLDIRRLHRDEPDAALPAAVEDPRLVRLPHGEHGRRHAEDGRRHRQPGDRYAKSGFDEIDTALKRMESRDVFGKIILRVD